MNDVVQRLASGKLTSDEKRGVSEFSKQYDTEDMEPLKPIAVSFALNKLQKQAMFQDIKQRIIDGGSPDQIAQDLVLTFDIHLKEKEHEAYPDAYEGLEKEFVNSKSGKKGGFKRV